MRFNDDSYDCRDWSHSKLARELRIKANLESFTIGFPKTGLIDANAVREETRLYRETWMQPLLNEVLARLVGAR